MFKLMIASLLLSILLVPLCSGAEGFLYSPSTVAVLTSGDAFAQAGCGEFSGDNDTQFYAHNLTLPVTSTGVNAIDGMNLALAVNCSHGDISASASPACLGSYAINCGQRTLHFAAAANIFLTQSTCNGGTTDMSVAVAFPDGVSWDTFVVPFYTDQAGYLFIEHAGAWMISACNWTPEWSDNPELSALFGTGGWSCAQVGASHWVGCYPSEGQIVSIPLDMYTGPRCVALPAGSYAFANSFAGAGWGSTACYHSGCMNSTVDGSVEMSVTIRWLRHAFLPGDLSDSGDVGFDDINRFVCAISSSQAVFEAQYADGVYWAGDMNGDGNVSMEDLDEFIAAMSQ